MLPEAAGEGLASWKSLPSFHDRNNPKFFIRCGPQNRS
jgi:hypothetical protein